MKHTVTYPDAFRVIPDGFTVMVKECQNGHISFRNQAGKCHACLTNQKARRHRSSNKTVEQVNTTHKIADILLAKELGITVEELLS